MDGKKLVSAIGVWVIIKGVLNLILGFSIENVLTLILGIVLVALIFAGIPYMNYIVAGYMAVVVLVHLPANIAGGHIIYLIEAVVDVVAAVILIRNEEIKSMCRKK